METTTQKGKVIYTAKTHTTGGRAHGIAKSSDGRLEVRLSTPGSTGGGTNPEQLFAAGWSACFEGAMAIIAQKMRVPLPDTTAIDAEVDLCANKGEYTLQARMNISIPGIDPGLAQQIVDEAANVCPYSKAIKGNVDVEYNLIDN